MRLLPFEDRDPSLIPMSARRALDRAGLKLSLRAWQALSLPVRATLAALGEEDIVDPEHVASLLDSADPRPEAIDAPAEPDPERVPAELSAALGSARPIGDGTWRALSPLERYALFSYARRGRSERLDAAYAALFERSRA
jgi:hypothetical protein